MKSSFLILIGISLALVSCGQKKNDVTPTKTETSKTTSMSTNNNDTNKVVKTEEEWKNLLSPEQYRVLREKGTEAPYSGKYYLNKEKGVYVCAACGNELFTSDMKFDSHCGWPSFDREIAGGKIKTHIDTSFGMVRTEILCGKCGSHLGHLFDDGPTATGARYCVNSLSLDFKKK
jgi:methionine-R-sulfoxide reductase